MGLDEFMTLPAMERRQRFDELSVSDRLAFVSSADSVELIIGGYPTEERILDVAQHAANAMETNRSRDGKTMH